MFSHAIRQYLDEIKNPPNVNWAYKCQPTRYLQLAHYKHMAFYAKAAPYLAQVAYCTFEPIVGFLGPADIGGAWITPLMVPKPGTTEFEEGYPNLKGQDRKFVHAACMGEFSFTLKDFFTNRLRCMRAEDGFVFHIRLAVKMSLGMN